MSKLCFRLPINDYTIGNRAISCSLLSMLSLKENDFAINLEQVYQSIQHTRRFAEVPLTLGRRDVGVSHFRYSVPVFVRYLSYPLRALMFRHRPGEHESHAAHPAPVLD